MNRSFSEDAVDQGTRLVLFALTPRVRPSENRDYYELIQAYKTQPDVREAAKVIAHAMRIQLCDDSFFLDSTGPIAILSPGSLFVPRLVDFRSGMKVNERLGYGLLFFVIAAYVFPSADALAEDTVSLGHKIVDRDVVRFATDTCERLRESLRADPHADEKTTRGFEHLLNVRPTAKEGDQKNLTYMVRYLLDHYHTAGLFLKDAGTETEIVYYARTQYRLQVRRMVREAMPAMDRLYKEAQALRSEEVAHG